MHLLGQLLNIHYPSIINADIYIMTGQHLWNDKIDENRLRFIGHILRMENSVCTVSYVMLSFMSVIIRCCLILCYLFMFVIITVV